MNCIQLINSLLFTAKSTAHDDTAFKNANVDDAVAGNGDRGSMQILSSSMRLLPKGM
jgi:hypothetical protein